MTTPDPLQLACPQCNTINRVPAAKVGDDPVCGRCGQALLDGRPVELSDANFDKVVGASDLPVVVDFWAPWCGPCRMMAPQFEAAAAQLEPALRLAKVDTQAQPTLAQKFGIRSIPTLVLFRQGRELARQAGAMGTADIVRWTRQFL